MVLQETSDSFLASVEAVTQLIPFMYSTVPCLVQKDGECLVYWKEKIKSSVFPLFPHTFTVAYSQSTWVPSLPGLG